MIQKEETLRYMNEIRTNTLMETLNIEYSDVGEDFLVATMPVSSKVLQPDGILHGGATLALAESVGSPVSLLVIDPRKYAVRGLQITANHLRSVKSGFVIATARFIHKGNTTHLVEIRIEDESGNLVSICKLTNIILPKSE
jgi:uncharacterized protein (TIGR00369 family)